MVKSYLFSLRAWTTDGVSAAEAGSAVLWSDGVWLQHSKV